MKGKKLLPLIGSICLAIILTALLLPACAEAPAPTPTPAPAPVEPIVLKYAAYWPPTYFLAEGWDDPFFNEFEEATGGRVKVERYYAESLAKSKEIFDAVSSGIADLGFWGAASYIPGLVPMEAIGSLPFGGQDPYKYARALDKLRKQGWWEEPYAKRNVLQLHTNCFHNADFMFVNRKPLKVEDLAGLKTRALGYTGAVAALVGMVPVVLSPAESYEGMQRGIIDTYYHSPASMVGRHLEELCKYYLKISWIRVAGVGGGIIVNKDTLAELPPDIRKILLEMGDELGIRYIDNEVGYIKAAMEKIEAAGIEVYSWPDSEVARFKAAVNPAWENWIAEMEAIGEPGREIATEFVRLLREEGEEPPWSP